MKTRWILNLSACLLVTVGTVAVIVWPRPKPDYQRGFLYQHYANRDGFLYQHIDNYALNDTVTVSVSLVEASNDSAWAVMKWELPSVFPQEDAYQYFRSRTISIKYVDKKDPREGGSTEEGRHDISVVEHHSRTLFIFEIENKYQETIILQRMAKRLVAQYQP